MSDHPRHGGRSRILAAAAVVLAVVGAVVLALALRASTLEPLPGPARTSLTAGSASDRAPVPTPTTAPAPGAGDLAPAAPPAAGTDTVADPPAAADTPDLGPVLPASDPVALRIPSIGVDSTVLEPLTLGADGVLPAPTDYALPGWYTGGPNPGQFGPSVIAGHVDGPDGPAVFYRLGELAVGATIDVARADGTVATFVVDAVERYAKADFPTSRVYGNTTDRAEIRLITCGGAFDRTTGHYVDNIVAFSHLVD